MTRRALVAVLLILGGCASTPKPKPRPLKTSGWRSEARSFQQCMAGPGTPADMGYLTGCTAHDYDGDGDVDLDDCAVWMTLDPKRTADSPDSWLVLFNRNDEESRAWALWYLAGWGIPITNSLGLDVPGDEKIHVDVYVERIRDPIRAFLQHNRSTIAAQPQYNRTIMGIIVGFRVPGVFYVTEPLAAPRVHGGGGYSVTNALANLAVVSGPTRLPWGTWQIFPTTPNKHYRKPEETGQSRTKPDKAGINRQNLGAGLYMTARLDGPTLEDVKRLSSFTEITMSSGGLRKSGENFNPPGLFYHDAVDPTLGVWDDLVEAQAALPELPWRPFDSDTEGTPDAVFRASWHRITGWNQRIWDQTGPRLLAIDHNSFGATTVRSTTAHGSRFVPVALFQGGYLAAVGSSAEPLQDTLPDLTVLLTHLIHGERLGVAFFMANPHVNWMWELVGDPLLTIAVSNR